MFSEAQLYSSASFLQQVKARRMIKKYSSWLEAGPEDLVLDIGSGPGDVTATLASILPHPVKKIVGVDMSREMVCHARKETSDPDVSYYRMDITDPDTDQLVQFLPPTLRKTKFNKVFAFYLLHWLHNKFNKALENMSWLMAEGGQGMAIQYVSIPVFDQYPRIGASAKWAPYLVGKVLDFNPLRCCSDPTSFMRESLEAVGLRADHIDSYSGHNTYSSRADLAGLMTSIDPFLAHIPLDLHAEYMDDFLAGLTERCIIGRDGSVAVPFTIMTCAFSKPSS